MTVMLIIFLAIASLMALTVLIYVIAGMVKEYRAGKKQNGPGGPAAPNEPVIPEEPVAPGEPGVPSEPAVPDEAAEPSAPVEPGEPND